MFFFIYISHLCISLPIQCLNLTQLLAYYGLNPESLISPSQFTYLCPALLYQIDSRVCIRHYHQMEVEQEALEPVSSGKSQASMCFIAAESNKKSFQPVSTFPSSSCRLVLFTCRYFIMFSDTFHDKRMWLCPSYISTSFKTNVPDLTSALHITWLMIQTAIVLLSQSTLLVWSLHHCCVLLDQWFIGDIITGGAPLSLICVKQ